ncbi:unnamed protein product [Tetraodon nigroviridis]|uniref:Hexosyltransferase n=1 Tax=Tetraodon nigroviridis TaxID=99883 RepID=Q4RGQ2_TETNG|nr:unnamed protein product [Tetraodon nigroviridis]
MFQCSLSLCKLRTHQWCFLLFNVLLFHALLFGADFVEEYLLQPTPGVYTDGMVIDVREKARKLDLSVDRENISQDYGITNPSACRNSDLFLLTLVFSSAANFMQRDAIRRTVIQSESPDRDAHSPGYVPPALYPDKYLPEYCDGTAYVLSQDVVRKVYVAALTVHLPVPVDVFVGLCAQRAGVAPTHSARWVGDKHVRYNACCYRYLFNSARMRPVQLERVWRDLRQRDGQCSVLQTYYGVVTCKTLTYLNKLPFFYSEG